MGQINWNRVLLGGVVAGLIIDVVQWVLNGVVLRVQWQEAMQALGRPIHETPDRMMLYVALGVMYGIVAVALYAAVRPRFGAGPMTALYAAVLVWVLGYVLPTVSWMPMGLFSAGLMTSATIGGLVGVVAATVAGAWLYQESPSGAGSTARRAA
jgi:hypothetical protein